MILAVVCHHFVLVKLLKTSLKYWVLRDGFQISIQKAVQPIPKVAERACPLNRVSSYNMQSLATDHTFFVVCILYAESAILIIIHWKPLLYILKKCIAKTHTQLSILYQWSSKILPKLCPFLITFLYNIYIFCWILLTLNMHELFAVWHYETNYNVPIKSIIIDI